MFAFRCQVSSGPLAFAAAEFRNSGRWSHRRLGSSKHHQRLGYSYDIDPYRQSVMPVYTKLPAPQQRRPGSFSRSHWGTKLKFALLRLQYGPLGALPSRVTKQEQPSSEKAINSRQTEDTVSASARRGKTLACVSLLRSCAPTLRVRPAAVVATALPSLLILDLERVLAPSAGKRAYMSFTTVHVSPTLSNLTSNLNRIKPQDNFNPSTYSRSHLHTRSSKLTSSSTALARKSH